MIVNSEIRATHTLPAKTILSNNLIGSKYVEIIYQRNPELTVEYVPIYTDVGEHFIDLVYGGDSDEQ